MASRYRPDSKTALVPKLKARNIVVMDNLGSHKSQNQERDRAAGILHHIRQPQPIEIATFSSSVSPESHRRWRSSRCRRASSGIDPRYFADCASYVEQAGYAVVGQFEFGGLFRHIRDLALRFKISSTTAFNRRSGIDYDTINLRDIFFRCLVPIIQ